MGLPAGLVVEDAHDDVAPGRPGRRVAPERLPNPSLPLIAADAGAHYCPTDRDPQTRRPRGLILRRPKDPNVEPSAAVTPPLGIHAAELRGRCEPLGPSECQGRQGIRRWRPLRRRRFNTARPVRVRIRRRNPWRRARFRRDVGRKVSFIRALYGRGDNPSRWKALVFSSGTRYSMI